MHAIIETKNQLDRLQEYCEDSCFVQIISNNDNFHPKFSNIVAVYYHCLNSKGYIFPVNHSETFNLDWKDILDFLNKHKLIYVLDKKFHDYFLPNTLKSTDIQFNILNKTNKVFKADEYDTPAHIHYYREHYFRSNLNSIIPITKHLEKWENVFNQIKQHMNFRPLTWFDNDYTSVFKRIEQEGIKISPTKFNHFFEPTFDDYSINKNKIHTLYNLYNITTRPSNAFNNINFAALPKENGARNVFIPDNDLFIEYDFTAYHPSLIGSLFNYNFSSDPYNDLASLLGTTKEEAKEITFKNLYGGIKEEYRDREYFRQVNGLIKKMWLIYQQENQVKLATGRTLHKQDNLSPTKIFNYYVQSLETKSNVELVTKVLDYLETKKSKVVLYTYDSILVDFSKEDGIEVVTTIKQLLESTGYTTKIKRGADYGL
jgi:hypothetical protein